MLATKYLGRQYGNTALIVGMGIYGTLFAWSSIFMIRHWKQLTTTEADGVDI